MKKTSSSLDSSFQFLLEEAEFILIKNKKPEVKLACSVMLKYFQMENCYPTGTQDIPPDLINHLADQLHLDANLIKAFDWQGRSSERCRQEIREFLGYKKATIADGETMVAWLMKNSLPNAPTLAQCSAQAYHYLRELKIEPFAPKELSRYINSAFSRFEKQFFNAIKTELSEETIALFYELLQEEELALDINDLDENKELEEAQLKLRHLKKDLGGAQLKNVLDAIKKIDYLRKVKLPTPIFATVSRKFLTKYYRRIMAEFPSHIKEHGTPATEATMAIFCHVRLQLLMDSLADLFLRLIHAIKSSSEKFIDQRILAEVKCVHGKFDILYELSQTAAENPDGIIQKEIYPKVSRETLQELAVELRSRGKWYQTQVKVKMRSLYSHAHRTILLQLLPVFRFQTDREDCSLLLKAIDFIKENHNSHLSYYENCEAIPLKNIISTHWQEIICKQDSNNLSTKIMPERIDRMNYEMAVLEALHDKLQCKAIWIEEAYRYRDPNKDLPTDFNENPEPYFKLLGLPLEEKVFVSDLKQQLTTALQDFNKNFPHNTQVKIIQGKKEAKFRISPAAPQSAPRNLDTLHKTIQRVWSNINLIDMVKEVDLRIGFTKHFQSISRYQKMEPEELRKRLLLCLYGIGSNMGLKRVSIANTFVTEAELHYVKRRFIHVENVRAAIVDIVDAILAIRDPLIWTEATTGVACDSKHISSWDQNLMTQWHARYRKKGVMVYWHVDKKALCVYSQLKTCTSSEVGSMFQGILNHSTKMDIDKSYVDTHGQSTIGFGFSPLLKVDLLPRLKNINHQKLYATSEKDKQNLQNLTAVIKGTINWKMIEENYREVVKHAAALKIGTVEADVLIKQFSKDNYQHPVYKALTEIGKAVKTIFLCRYLSDEALRIEIHEALNVVERLNSIMGFIFYGKLGEISSNNKEAQELSIVCLHLLQTCMVYINTLIIQKVLSGPEWNGRLTSEDKRALTPLLHGHINPYGLFPLNMETRLLIEMMQNTGIKREKMRKTQIEYA